MLLLNRTDPRVASTMGVSRTLSNAAALDPLTDKGIECDQEIMRALASTQLRGKQEDVTYNEKVLAR